MPKYSKVTPVYPGEVGEDEVVFTCFNKHGLFTLPATYKAVDAKGKVREFKSPNKNEKVVAGERVTVHLPFEWGQKRFHVVKKGSDAYEYLHHCVQNLNSPQFKKDYGYTDDDDANGVTVDAKRAPFVRYTEIVPEEEAENKLKSFGALIPKAIKALEDIIGDYDPETEKINFKPAGKEQLKKLSYIMAKKEIKTEKQRAAFVWGQALEPSGAKKIVDIVSNNEISDVEETFARLVDKGVISKTGRAKSYTFEGEKIGTERIVMQILSGTVEDKEPLRQALLNALKEKS